MALCQCYIQKASSLLQKHQNSPHPLKPGHKPNKYFQHNQLQPEEVANLAHLLTTLYRVYPFAAYELHALPAFPVAPDQLLPANWSSESSSPVAHAQTFSCPCQNKDYVNFCTSPPVPYHQLQSFHLHLW